MAERDRCGERTHEVRLVELHAQAVVLTGKADVGVGQHLPHRVLAQDPDPAVTPAVEQHLREHRQVRGGREDARVTGDTAERCGHAVVYLSADHPAPRLVLRGRDPVAHRRRRQVPGVGHPQRPGHLLAEQPVQPLPGDPFQDRAQRDQPDVGVVVLVSRAHTGGQRYAQHLRDGHVAVPGQGDVLRQAGGVRQHLAHRHPGLAALRELGKIPRHRRIQRQPAGVHLAQREDGGEQLGQRGDVEHGVRAHRYPLGGRQLDRLPGHNAVPHRIADGRVRPDDAGTGDQHHRARVGRVPGVVPVRHGKPGGVGDQLPGVLCAQARPRRATGPQQQIRREPDSGSTMLCHRLVNKRLRRSRRGRGHREDPNGCQHTRHDGYPIAHGSQYRTPASVPRCAVLSGAVPDPGFLGAARTTIPPHVQSEGWSCPDSEDAQVWL
jgi:hypothetical protein